MSLSFSGFLANLKQSGCQIPDIESAKVIFSVIITFCLTKTEKTEPKNMDVNYIWMCTYVANLKFLA